MAMIACKECGTQISRKAAACPKCGSPLPKKTSGCAMVAATFFAVMLVGMIAAKCSEPPERPLSKAERAHKKREDAAEKKLNIGIANAQILAQELKRASRNPDSFKLEEAIVIIDTNAACLTYRAQNGFGGYSRGKAVLGADGSTVKTDDSDGFAELWNRDCVDKKGRDVTAGLNLVL